MAYQFNGSSQYLSLSLAVSNVPLTMACFVKLNAYPASGSIGSMISLDDSPTYLGFRMSSEDNGTLRAQVLNADASVNAIARSASSLTTGAWQHCAAVFTSSVSRQAFIDGTGGTINTTSAAIDSPTRTVLAMSSGFNNQVTYFHNGFIAEAAIWNVALTDAEIASLAAGFTPDQIRPQSLQFYAPLVRNLVDVRGGRTITNVNSATVATHPRIIT